MPNPLARRYWPKLLIGPNELVSERAADEVTASMNARPSDYILGLATGSSPRLLYAGLRERAKDGRLKFSPKSTFGVGLDEYFGKTLYRSELLREVCTPLGLPDCNCIVPFPNPGSTREGDICSEFEDQMRRLGAVHLQILGIGENGHIAFNEPGSDFDSPTRIIPLTESTRRANAVHFGGDIDKVPTLAVTSGLARIRSAQKIIVFAFGDAKKLAVKKSVTAPRWQADYPASALIHHGEVTWYLDEAAASALPRRSRDHATIVS